MSRFWGRPAQRASRRRRLREQRQLFVEPLEDRRLLAIAGTLTAGNLTIAGDNGANALEISNLAADTYLLTSATDNITITDNDGTLTLLGNGTPAVTVTAPAAAVKNLAIDLKGAGDTLTIDALIGSAAAALKSLAVSDTGAAGTDLVNLNGTISIDGAFTLAGVENAVLTSSVTIDTEQGNNSNAGDIDLSGAAVSADAAGRDLTLDASTGAGFTAGTAILGVFSNSPGPQLVRNLTVNSGTGARITGDIQTQNDQAYDDAATLAANATLTGTNVVFSGPLDDDGSAATPSNLTIAILGGGIDAFSSPVGGVHPLTSLTAGGTTQINGGSVATTGDQTYGNAVTLGADTTLTGANVTFQNRVDDDGTAATSSNLIVNASGITKFQADVGTIAALTSLATDAAGSTQISSAAPPVTVQTTGSQNYADAVTLGSDANLTSTSAGNITLGSTLDGVSNLQINTTGITTFAGAVGFGTPLVDVITDPGGSTRINGGSIHTTGDQIFHDDVTLGGDTTLTAFSVLFDTTLADDGNGGTTSNLIVNASSTTTFNGAVGGASATTALTSLTTDAPGTTDIRGGSIRTVQAQVYNDPVTITSLDATLTSTANAAITFAKTVSGAVGLSVDTGGTTTFGDTVTIRSLTTDAGGTTRVNGGSITTTGNQTYNDNVVVSKAVTHLTTFTAQAFSLAATGSLNGLAAGESVEIDATNTITIDGPLGGTQPLDKLTLQATLAVTQSAKIVGSGLELLGGGPFALTDANNDFGTLAASASGFVNYRDANALTVGTVNATVGIASGNPLTLTAGGLLTIADDISAAGKTVDINAAGVSETAGTITSDKLRLRGAGSFALGLNNDVATLAADVTGTLSYNDANALTVGSITANAITTSGINTHANDATLTLGGALTVANDMTALGKIVDILATSATETGGVAASDKLRLIGTGAFTFNGPNVVNTIAAVVGDLAYVDVDALTIGTVTANSTSTAGITATGAVSVTAAAGPLTAASSVAAVGAVQLMANETTAPDTNDLAVNAGAAVSSATGNVTLQAGDNITLLGGIFANLLTGQIVITSLDGVDSPATGAAGITGTVFTLHGTLQASQITVTGSAQDDDFDVRLAGITSTNPPLFDGGSGAESRTALIRDGRDFSVNANKRPYFVPAIAPADGVHNSIGDQLFLDDSGFATPNADYVLFGNQAIRIGGVQPFANFQNVELLKLTTGRGNNDVTANMNAGPLPNIVQIVTNDPLDNDNRFQVEGSAAADKISIGDVNTTLTVAGGSLRAHFELAGMQRLWVRGNFGADTIDNISHVPGVLDGGASNDTINSIVNDPLSKLVLKKNILTSTFKDVTLVLGNLGADQLFVGSGAIDGTVAAGSVQAALRNFHDTGITFLIGDYKPGSMQADGRFKSLNVASPPFGEPGDTYSSSTNAFQHGFVSLKDNAPARGIFKFGAGDKVKFSSTIAWLKAQIFVGVAKDNLIKLLAKQLEVFTRPVPDSGEAIMAAALAPPAPVTMDPSLLTLLATDMIASQKKKT